MLSEQEFNKICHLARISIPEQNREAFMQKFQTIFDWIDKLKEIDVSNVSIDSEWSSMYNEGRDDVSCKNDNYQDVLANAQDVKYDMYSVPKVIE